MNRIWQLSHARLRPRWSLVILALLGILAPTAARAQEVRVTVGVGSPGDHWVSTMQWRVIERATVDGAFGYAVTFDMADNSQIQLFWPRSQIHLQGRLPPAPLRALKLGDQRILYPEMLTRRSLPDVYRGVIQLEGIYRDEARAGIKATEAFLLVFMLADGGTAVVPSASRLLSGTSASRSVVKLLEHRAAPAAVPAAKVVAEASAPGAAAVPAAKVVAETSAPAATAVVPVPVCGRVCGPIWALRTQPAQVAPRAGAATEGTSQATRTAGGARAPPPSTSTVTTVRHVAPTAAKAARSACGSSTKLTTALKKAGHTPAAGESTHHIVARNARNAEAARDALQRVGMDIDDAANGVFLPANTRSPNPGGAAVHSTVHTDAYYRQVNELLSDVTSRAEAEAILHHIRTKLLAGGL